MTFRTDAPRPSGGGQVSFTASAGTPYVNVMGSVSSGGTGRWIPPEDPVDTSCVGGSGAPCVWRFENAPVLGVGPYSLCFAKDYPPANIVASCDPWPP